MDYLEGGLKLADFISGIVEKVQAKNFTQKNSLRACYLETQNNIALIDAIQKTALKNTEADAPAFAALVNGLEINYTAAILFLSGEEKGPSDVYHFLQKKGQINPEKIDEKLKPSVKKWKYESVLDALFFIVTRITVLQKICSSGETLKGLLRGLDLAERIENIRDRSRLIVTQLEPLVK